MKNIENFAKDLGTISSYFKRRMNLAKFDNYTIKDCLTIEYLFKKKLLMHEIANILNLSPSTITTHIDKLIKLDLVKREFDKNDRRKIYVKLTQKGDITANLIMIEHIEISKDILKTLNECESKSFKNLINKVANNL